MLCLPPEDARRKAGSAGKPYPYVDVRRLPPRASCSSAGRTSSPATGATPRRPRPRFRDGWLLTGDVAERDEEGNYWIRGRLKEMVVSGGENVYPAEIEAVLHEHPAVVDAAVVGVPDERWGEVCAAFVVTDGAGRARTSCASTAASGSRASRCRRAFHVVDELPRNSMGKIQQVRAEASVAVTDSMTDVVTNVDGRPLSKRGLDTRRRLLDAAEQVFGDLGYHDASVVKLAEAAGVAAGHLLPLLRLEEGDLRRARARPQPPRAARDEGRLVAGNDAARGGAARLRGVLPVHRRASRRSTGSSARPSSSRPRCCATTTTASRAATSRRCATPSSRARSADARPRGRGLRADGHGRADRHALDPLGRRQAAARERVSTSSSASSAASSRPEDA